MTVEGVVDLYSHETEEYIRQDANPICVDWKVFAEVDGDEPSGKPVSEGQAYTTSDIDFLVKVRSGPYITPFGSGSTANSDLGRGRWA